MDLHSLHSLWFDWAWELKISLKTLETRLIQQSTILSEFKIWHSTVVESQTEFDTKVELLCRHRLLDRILHQHRWTIRSESRCRHGTRLLHRIQYQIRSQYRVKKWRIWCVNICFKVNKQEHTERYLLRGGGTNFSNWFCQLRT